MTTANITEEHNEHLSHEQPKNYIIKYWQQDTLETGRWMKTELMTEENAKVAKELYERSEIIFVQ